MWSTNRAEWALVQYATAKLGVILVNINPAYRFAELEYALGQSGCRWVFSAQENRGSDFVEMVSQVRRKLPELERAVFFDTDEWAEVAAGDPSLRDQVRSAELDFDEPINIQYTSGTTGFPKGATLTHHNILNNGYFVALLLGYTERDRVCIPVPLYHCFGMVMGNLGATAHGSCMVYPAESFEPEATLRACAQERCTSLYGVPTMFIAQLGHENFGQYDLSSLRTGIMAGSPCPIEVMKRVASEMGIDEMAIAFGMTETSPVTTQVRRDDTLERRCATVGYTHPQIADVQVIGVPDERYGEELMAWVVLRPGAEVGEDVLREFCRGQIAYYKIPRYFKFVDSYPMTVTGKVQKFKMRETAVQELGLDRAATIATS